MHFCIPLWASSESEIPPSPFRPPGARSGPDLSRPALQGTIPRDSARQAILCLAEDTYSPPSIRNLPRHQNQTGLHTHPETTSYTNHGSRQHLMGSPMLLRYFLFVRHEIIMGVRETTSYTIPRFRHPLTDSRWSRIYFLFPCHGSLRAPKTTSYRLQKPYFLCSGGSR